MTENMNIGSEGVRIEHRDIAVELDYTENQLVVEYPDIESDSYQGPEIIQKEEESIEFFIRDIVRSLPKTEGESDGQRYRIEVLGNLPGTEECISEIYEGRARVNSGIHEEDGFPREAYRLWESLSKKADKGKITAD